MRFESGYSYTLTAGVLGMGGNMLEGVPLEISLCHRPDGSNLVPVASQIVTNSLALFPDRTHLVDFSVTLPEVRSSDPWVGHSVGIRFLSTLTDTNKMGGTGILTEFDSMFPRWSRGFALCGLHVSQWGFV